jgi:hypothetical protein
MRRQWQHRLCCDAEAHATRDRVNDAGIFAARYQRILRDLEPSGVLPTVYAGIGLASDA